MTTEEGSAALRQRCQDMADRLLTLRDQFEIGDIYHVQHGDFADRAAQFTGFVDAALLLTDQTRFAQAFALLRSALEHWAADAILMLGERFVRHYPNTSADEYEQILTQWKEGELPWIVEEPTLGGRRGSTLRLVVRGLTDEENGWVLHPIYFEADFFDPFYGHPEVQEDFADWGLERAKNHAVEQRRRYNSFFAWGAILESLVLNGVVEERHAVHLKVHYGFLSAFVHSQKSAHELLSRPSFPKEDVPGHCTVELALLYAGQLLGRYALTFVAMTKRPPEVGLTDREGLTESALQLLAECRHLWFLEDAPQPIDRNREILTRAAEQYEAGSESPLPPPDELDVVEVRYYRNPLDRLRRMHTTTTELLTGLTDVNPWA